MMSSVDSSQSITEAVISVFSSNYEGFDASVARKLADLIQQTYLQFDRAENLGSWKFSASYQLIAPLGTHQVPFGFVASEVGSNNVFVVFRGTKKFIEWFKDANIRLVSYKDSTRRNEGEKEPVEIEEEIAEGIVERNQSSIIIDKIDDDFGYVTAGFRGIYVGLRQQMLDALNQCPPNSRIWVTGHSLGGALATLAVPDILKNTHFQDSRNIVLYTFASPRCGDRKFAISFEETQVRHWRIANTEDFVTMLPFPTGNVMRAESPDTPPEPELGHGGVNEVEKNPNPLFGFFKEIYDRRKRRMPDYVHTGTPIYFTIHEAALERHHNLNDVYMRGISQLPIKLAD